jgi:hypothetical protein
MVQLRAAGIRRAKLLGQIERQLNADVLRCQNFNVGRHVLKVGRVARDDLDRSFAAGKCRVQGIVNSAAHDTTAARLANRRFVVRPRQWLHLDRSPETQSQFGRCVRRHFVKAGERGESLRECVGVGERTHGIFQRREAGRVFRVRLQDRPDHDPRIKEGHRV